MEKLRRIAEQVEQMKFPEGAAVLRASDDRPDSLLSVHSVIQFSYAASKLSGSQ